MGKIISQFLISGLLILSIMVGSFSTNVRVTSIINELFADFNGDGFDDLAIGVPWEDVGGVENAGAVNVLYGSSGGLQVDSPDDQFWHQDREGSKINVSQAISLGTH